MKAVILAAGKGKRMGEITKELPKPMVQVQGKPVLDHIITGMRDHAKIQDFFIVTGHCADVIEDYFQEGAHWGVRCTYGRQKIPDGTGKAPELAAEWVGKEKFFLSYGDILIDGQEYADMVQSFSADALITVKLGEDVKLGGAVVFDENFFLKDLIEKAAPSATTSHWYNAGVYIFPPTLFRYTRKLQKSARGEYELTDAIRAMAQDGIKIQGYEIKRHWADVRDPKVLADLNQSMES